MSTVSFDPPLAALADRTIELYRKGRPSVGPHYSEWEDAATLACPTDPDELRALCDDLGFWDSPSASNLRSNPELLEATRMKCGYHLVSSMEGQYSDEMREAERIHVHSLRRAA